MFQLPNCQTLPLQSSRVLRDDDALFLFINFFPSTSIPPPSVIERSIYFTSPCFFLCFLARFSFLRCTWFLRSQHPTRLVMGSGEGVEHGTPLMAELARALQLVRQLESYLANSAPADSCKSLAPEILYSIQKSILMAQSSSFDGAGAPPSTTGHSPCCENPCPPSEGHDRKQMKKNRNTLHKWTTQVRLIPGGAGGVEGPVDDGYSWRKYGQKDILGAKHPRAYYRCTHRNTQGCPAMKQVQRSDEDSLLFNITYRGIHSCLRRPHRDSASASEEQQNQRKKVKTESLDSEEAQEQASLSTASMAAWEEMPPEIFSLFSVADATLIGSSTLLSPVTLDSTCFLMSPYPINDETSDFGSELPVGCLQFLLMSVWKNFVAANAFIIGFSRTTGWRKQQQLAVLFSPAKRKVY